MTIIHEHNAVDGTRLLNSAGKPSTKVENTSPVRVESIP